MSSSLLSNNLRFHFLSLFCKLLFNLIVPLKSNNRTVLCNGDTTNSYMAPRRNLPITMFANDITIDDSSA